MSTRWPNLRKYLLGLGLGLSLSIPDALFSEVHSHGAHGGAGGEQLEPGEFQSKPVITIEGHGGFERNLQGRPEHYAIDAMVGFVLEWGLENGGSFSFEAQGGSAQVFGEAEHFYGIVHVEEDHSEETTTATTTKKTDDHDHDHDHDHEEDDHHHEEGEEGEHHSLGIQQISTAGAGHDHGSESSSSHSTHSHSTTSSSHEGHDHSHGSGAPYRRTDVKGYVAMRYAPNDRLAFTAEWKPYYVTGNQGEDKQGLKNEIHFGGIYAFGDGDVNFALGDGLETIADGIFISAKNATGWESDGMYVGNYTDVWPGFGFNYDLLNVTISGGPRFYSPGSYAKLPSRTDWGGEIALELPVGKNAVLFAHWEPMYSSQGGKGWGKGFQHHVGTGVTFSF